MATGSSVTSALEAISRHHLECSICQERYQQPKILDCLHSFCEQCLLKYSSSKHPDSAEIPCPLCRQKTILPERSVQGLKTNFYLVGLVEEFELQEKVVCSGDTKLRCVTCDDDNEATHHCVDCAQNVCSHCHSSHKRITATANHTVVSLEDIHEGKVKLKKENLKQHPKCPVHEGEVTRFFCTTCETLICRDCTVIDHCKPEHSYIDRNLATSTYKKSLVELISPLENKMMELQKSREKVSKVKEDLGITVERVMTEVQDRAAKIRAEVTAEENCILDHIKSIRADREQNLDECEKTIYMASERMQYSVKTAKEVTRTASDGDFLSLYPTFSKDLNSLTSQSVPVVDNRLAFLQFKQSEGVGDINLGVVVTEGKWELFREFGSAGRGPGQFYYAWDVAARQPDEIAVTDYSNKQVVIYRSNGTQKSTIPLQGNPRGIATTSTENRLVVVQGIASHHVKVFNDNNTLAYEFPTVPPSEVGKTAVDLQCVAVKSDGTIVVGDVNRSVLTTHRPMHGELLCTIPVKIKPYFLAVYNDRFVISDYLKSKLVVDVANGNGTTKRTINPTINGQPVSNCNGVYSDCSGIYVTMHTGSHNTGHIHHYDPEGSFLKCIAQGLYLPFGITLTSAGQLIVADYNSVKMYHQV